jgi:DNA-binding transcriptional MerR regulator
VNSEKSPEAFRTISEVADWLGTPAHVLRFWESRFPQIKPVKRAGGRRYYRPADMELLGGIKRLLHDDGMTIRGVQKLLREQGVRRVADMSPPLATDLAEALSREREQSVAEAPARPARATGSRPGPPASAAADTAPAGGPDAPAAADLTDWPVMPGAPEAPMAEDLPPEAPEPAEVLPFVLSPRARTEALPPSPPPFTGTPDLFDPRDPEPGTPGTAAPRLRMPAIPPDPADSDPLPAHGPRRPALPRRASPRNDDRLTKLFQRLADLRARMDRSDP